MPIQCVMAGTCKCSFGAAPTPLMVIPSHMVMAPTPCATIMDYAPFVNIIPFGVCMTPSNPMVAAATAAALGVLTPMPCIPATAAPWIVGNPMVMHGTFPALNNSSTLMCMWGGVINFVMPGQFFVQV